MHSDFTVKEWWMKGIYKLIAFFLFFLPQDVDAKKFLKEPIGQKRTLGEYEDAREGDPMWFYGIAAYEVMDQKRKGEDGKILVNKVLGPATCQYFHFRVVLTFHWAIIANDSTGFLTNPLLL